VGRQLDLHKYGDRSDLKAHNQIQVQAYINGSVQNAYLWQQKNANTFIVTTVVGYDGTDKALTTANSATCKLVNSASPTVGQMSVLATPNVGPGFYVSRITNRFVYDFSSPVVKYFWGFSPAADVSRADYPQYLHVTLPFHATSASTNLAP